MISPSLSLSVGTLRHFLSPHPFLSPVASPPPVTRQNSAAYGSRCQSTLSLWESFRCPNHPQARERRNENWSRYANYCFLMSATMEQEMLGSHISAVESCTKHSYGSAFGTHFAALTITSHRERERGATKKEQPSRHTSGGTLAPPQHCNKSGGQP
ncbi:uncharacterized protein LOC114290817 isoform X2 [Camellia sinensis]|uniref:uncharacterized protein LOC114290817 isoform X2 n=1 Tax=Camellia sinensis TaxID=4442 RepID=UPI0010361322|nr:uncharacterized protein LOC114290817 isoform X2 [Camellia sinensis]